MIQKVLAVLLTCMLAATAPVWAGGKESKEYRRGQAFCPSHMLVVGNVIVQPGRCYMLAVLRDRGGTFLAFLSPSAKIHGNERIRLSGDEGHEVRSKILYLVPIQATGLSGVVIPMNSIQLVQIHEEDRHDEEGENEQEGQQGEGRDHVVLVITGIPVPNLSVTFVVRF